MQEQHEKNAPAEGVPAGRAVKQRIDAICWDIEKAVGRLNEIKHTLPAHLPDDYAILLQDAALESEQITRRLRHLLYLSTDTRKTDYLMKAEKRLDMTVHMYDGMVELTFPGLSPKAKSWKNAEFLTDPAYSMLDRYISTHSAPRYKACTICFVHEYDRTLGIGRVLDYDNTEQKKLLDIAAAFFLEDDGGLMCDVYHTTVLGDADATRILIMPKSHFLHWLAGRAQPR